MGVFVAVGGIGVSIAVGGTGVFVAVAVIVGVGVTVGPNNCPGAQLDKTKLKSRTSIMVVRCLVFIFSPALSWAYPAATQSEPQNFMMLFQQPSSVAQQRNSKSEVLITPMCFRTTIAGPLRGCTAAGTTETPIVAGICFWIGTIAGGSAHPILGVDP